MSRPAWLAAIVNPPHQHAATLSGMSFQARRRLYHRVGGPAQAPEFNRERHPGQARRRGRSAAHSERNAVLHMNAQGNSLPALRREYVLVGLNEQVVLEPRADLPSPVRWLRLKIARPPWPRSRGTVRAPEPARRSLGRDWRRLREVRAVLSSCLGLHAWFLIHRSLSPAHEGQRRQWPRRKAYPGASPPVPSPIRASPRHSGVSRDESLWCNRNLSAYAP